MSAVELISRALPVIEPPELPEPGLCCVTGDSGPTISRSYAILPSFTGLDLLRAPQSDRVGISAWRVLTYTVPHHDPTKKRDLRPLQQSAWLCDGKELSLLDRQTVRKYVLAGVQAESWCGYVTTSYKKHGALLAPVNRPGQQRWQFELLTIDCSDRVAVADYWSRLRVAQDAGIARPLIESLDISPGYMGKIGWRLWRDFEAWARPRMLSGLYRFMTYLLPSQEELRANSDA